MFQKHLLGYSVLPSKYPATNASFAVSADVMSLCWYLWTAIIVEDGIILLKEESIGEIRMSFSATILK